MLFEQENLQQRKQELSQRQLYPYRPTVDPRNNDLAAKSLERWNGQREEPEKK